MATSSLARSDSPGRWTYEARTKWILKLMLAICGLVISSAFPPLFFVLVLICALTVPTPTFRIAVYSSVVCATGYLVSPFGWGFSHRPAPMMNYLLSLAFFGFTCLTGIRAIQRWRHMPGLLCYPVVLVDVVAVLAVAWLGCQSLFWQGTTVHYQDFMHVEIMLWTLPVIPVFGILDVFRRYTNRRVSEP